MDEQLVRLLYKYDVSHGLIHALLELVQFFLLVEERLEEVWLIFLEVDFRIAFLGIFQIEYLEYFEQQ